EDIAQDLATKDFENWKADNPDSAVASRLKQAFPGASDAEIAKTILFTKKIYANAIKGVGISFYKGK
ncbi:hypothetical protein, partial [Bacillus cereus]